MRWGISFLSTCRGTAGANQSYPRPAGLPANWSSEAQVSVGQIMDLGRKKTGQTAAPLSEAGARTRGRIIRLLARETALPEGWAAGQPVPRQTVRALVRACRCERGRLRSGHWTASLARYLALLSAIQLAFAARAPVARPRGEVFCSPSAQRSTASPVPLRTAPSAGTQNKKDRPGNRDGPDPC